MQNPPEPSIDAYQFYEEEWESYEELYEAFEWEVPEEFNSAEYLCDRWARADEERVALVADGPDREVEEYTFADLRDSANRLANYLADRGVERGEKIVVHGSQRPATLVTIVAAWKLGAVAVPVSTMLGADGLGYRVEDCEAAALVVDERGAEAARAAKGRSENLAAVLVSDAMTPEDDEAGFWTALDGESTTFENATTSADDVGTIIYTSGTTGRPKGVLLPHRVVLGHLTTFAMLVGNLEIRDDDVGWSPTEWTWVATTFVRLFGALYYGVTTLAYDRGKFDPEEVFAVIEKHGVTLMGAAPTALRMMSEEDPEPYDLSSVRVIGGGGEAFGEDLREWADDAFDDVVVYGGYGQTEANGLVGECPALGVRRPGRMGKAIAGHDVAVVDPDTLEVLPRGEEGEIAVRTEDDPVISVGYLNRPHGMDDIRREGWHLTSDLGIQDEDGYFAFRGRKDSVIICSGYRIAPQEIEEQLSDHEAVAEAGVVGVPDETRGEIPKASVVLSAGYEASDALAEELKQYVKDNLAKYEYPRELVFVESLPKTTTGKVDRAALEERASASE